MHALQAMHPVTLAVTVMDLMTKATEADDYQRTPEFHITSTETIFPTVGLGMVEVVAEVNPQTAEEVSTLEETIRTHRITDVPYIGVTPCLPRIEPGYTHLAYVQPPSITVHRCTTDYFGFVENTSRFNSGYLKEQKSIELTLALWDSTKDRLSFQTKKTGSSIWL
jgi:hypothetical protein